MKINPNKMPWPVWFYARTGVALGYLGVSSRSVRVTVAFLNFWHYRLLEILDAISPRAVFGPIVGALRIGEKQFTARSTPRERARFYMAFAKSAVQMLGEIQSSEWLCLRSSFSDWQHLRDKALEIA